jgi:signal transduction histidine kinase
MVALTAAVALPIAILLFFQYRSLGDLEETSAQVLETLSRQTADALVASVQADFRSPRFELAQIDDQAVERFDLEQVASVMAGLGRSSVRVEAFYLWARATRGPYDETVLEFRTGSEGAETPNPVERFRPAGPEGRQLASLAEAMAADRNPLGIETMTIDGRPHVVVVRPLWDSSTRERMVAFIGFRIDLERLRRVYLPGAITRFLERANERARLAPLVVTVLDDAGDVVFQSTPSDPARFVDERRVQLMFFDPNALGLLPGPPWRDEGPATWTLRTGYGNRTIADIAAASTASHRWQLGFLLVLTVGGLFLGARALVHEVRLAELKSNFASVSHELKTPLALIQLFAETLELGRVRTAERAKEYYAIINAEARKLTGLIDHILDLSRLESGVRPFTLEPIDLVDLVRTTVRDLEAQLAHSGAEVRSTLAPGPIVVSADAEAVQVAVRNLLSNAIKYSPGQRSVSVDVRRDGGQAVVSVVDKGTGIPRRHHRRIFQKFHRVSTGADEPRGTGLGLAIVAQVMRAHGGRVYVESEPGRGSTFTLAFPMAKEQAAVHEADTGDRGRASDAPGTA